jgi:hypothetical protein
VIICTLGYHWSAKTLRFILALLITLIILFIYNVEKSQLSHLVSARMAHPSQSSTSTTGVKVLSKMLVVSHFNEDIDWIDLFLGDKLPHIVYTRSSDPLAVHNFQVNKGREAVAYLRYIIDHYDNLPSLIAFVHEHRRSGHQTKPSDIVVALRALRWNKYSFMPLTGTMGTTYFRLGTIDTVLTVNVELWRDVLQQELGPPPPNGITTHCCATFVVRREAILTHSRAFYSRILEYMLASPRSDKATGQTLEYVWHIIFGEKVNLKYETCDIFVCDSNGTISVELAERQLA